MLKTKLEVVAVGTPDVTALSENEQRIFFEDSGKGFGIGERTEQKRNRNVTD